MRVSLRWLEDYVVVDVPVRKLVEMLVLSGTKVETVHSPGEAIEGVVVAEVLGVKDHPNADALTLVDVQLDGDRTQRVVCGVHNFSVGDRVPLATAGSRLPGMKVEERKIRGEASQGMLCSPKELGVSQDHTGILVLPADAPLGVDVVDVLGLDDTILTLEITPDRPDCMSIVGVAREVAALLGNDLNVPADDLVAADGVASPVEVEIQDPHGCPRYLARYIEGVRVGPSPAWMNRRLLAAGLRPVSNVVDATNYVMLELGQPLHAFDADLIDDRKIVVRRARPGERFTTLDGVERTLDGDDLMIADRKNALAIAGVMGGLGSEVSERTDAVVLESAHFHPASVGFTSRRHLLRTEASARFERGTNPEIVAPAATRAAKLMADHAGGKVSPDVVDAYPKEVARRTIRLRPARTDKVLGLKIRPERQAAYLRSIQLGVTESDGVIEVEIPGFRPDLTREIDLVEEVARLAGFDRLPSTIPAGRTGGLETNQAAERTIRRILAGMGLHEAWTGSFGSPRDADVQQLPPDHPARRMIMLSNPVSEEEPALRTSLLPGLLRSAARNVAHRERGFGLFEVARVYEVSTLPRPLESPSQEALVLGAVFVGERRSKSWNEPETGWDFFAAKGVVESLCRALRVSPLRFEAASGMPFHPSRAATIVVGESPLGALGELHPDVCAGVDVPEGTVAMELALAPLFSALPGRVRVESVPRFPANYIDLAVVVDDGVAAEQVFATIVEAGAPEVASARLFDIYRGEQIEADKKSLAYALELRAPDGTLTDDDAVVVRDRIVTALAERIGASIRG